MSKQDTYQRGGTTYTTTRIDFSGTWVNDLGSEVTFVQNVREITGTYKTNVGQPDPTEEFNVVGWAFGDQISFTTDFSKHGSLTAWVGQHTDHTGEEVIHTLWQLSRNVQDPNEKESLWAGIQAGSNQFRRKKP